MNATARLFTFGIVTCLLSSGMGHAEPVPEPISVGPSLDGDVVALFIPPTRSDRVYAATADKLYLYDDRSQAWDAVYPTRGESARVLAVAGYAKSSEVIYLVHSRGVAVTHDTGKHWTSQSLPGFSPDSGGAVHVAVNPTNREEALVVAGGKLWATSDYGMHWSNPPKPNAVDALDAIAYTGGDPARIVAAGGGSLYFTEHLDKPWSLPILTIGTPLKCSVSPSSGLVYAADASGSIQARVLLDSESGLERAVRLSGNMTALAVDCADKGLVWLAADKGLYSLNAQTVQAEPVLACTANGPIQNLTAHPRLAGCVLWSEAGQVRRLNLGDEAVPKQPLSTVFASLHSKQDGADPQKAGNDVDRLMKTLVEAHPTFGETAAAALRNSDFSPDDVSRWRKTVRSRNLLPQLTVEFTDRQWPSGVYRTQYYTNQFGVRIPDDIHQNDRATDLNGKSIGLRWDLGNLLFDADELHVSEETRRRAIDRNELLKDVSRLYYSRAELLVKEYLSKGKLSDKDHISLKLELAETSELLNQICGVDLFDPVRNPLLED